MTMNFAEQFCLRSRDSFVIETSINPDDSKFYFGRDELKAQIQGQLTRLFIKPGIPKMILYGAYGSGKTQTLAHIKYLLDSDPPKSLDSKKYSIHAVNVVLEMAQKSDAQDFHIQVVESLGKDQVTLWVETLFNKSSDFEKDLAGLFPGDSNMFQCMKNLRGGGDVPLAAWRWLSAKSLSASDQQRLQVTRNLGEVGTQDFVRVLVGFGKLANSLNQKLIFLVDECESLQNVTNADALESVHNFLRRLADAENTSTGFILATYALTVDDMPPLIDRPDIISRIGNTNIIEILTIDQPDNVQQFLKELLSELVDQELAENRINADGLNTAKDIFPFEKSAFDQFCNYATANPGDGTPRKIIDCLNECAIDAWASNSSVITEEMVDKLAPIVFNG